MHPSSTDNRTTKKPYFQPLLKEHGALRTLTQAGSGGTGEPQPQAQPGHKNKP